MSLEASFTVALLTRRLGSCLTGRCLSTQAPPWLSTRGLTELGEMPYANGLWYGFVPGGTVYRRQRARAKTRKMTHAALKNTDHGIKTDAESCTRDGIALNSGCMPVWHCYPWGGQKIDQVCEGTVALGTGLARGERSLYHSNS
ncbi:hypothetical protein HDV62DRAFT_89029 [Trichoderma sp. SZMC 28011]